MKKFDAQNLNEIVDEIISRGYDMNYAANMASDYNFEENPEIEFTDEFARRFGVIMDYFQGILTEIGKEEFREVINDLKIAVDNEHTTIENLIVILYKKDIEGLKELYEEGNIGYHVFRDKVNMLSSQEFDIDQIVLKSIKEI